MSDLVKINPVAEFNKKANNQLLAELTEQCISIESIDNDEQLSQAENLIDNLKTLNKDLDSIKKTFKEPIMLIAKQYDQIYNDKAAEINNAIEQVKPLIIAYKLKQAEILRAEQEKKQRELEEAQAIQDNILSKLDRIKTRFVVLIFGGYAVVNDKEISSQNGLESIEACDKLIQMINAKFSDPAEYTPFEEKFNALRNVILKHIELRKSKLKSINAEDMEEFFEQSRAKGRAILNQPQTPVVSIRPSEEQVNLILSQNDLKKATKGLRYTLKYEVVSKAIVPREFLDVSEDRMKVWIKAQGDAVKETLKEKPLSEQFDMESIPGIKLYLSVNNVKS